ncbi:glycosyltransferase [Nocardioides anomalus]|uniref:Glycosyltransferase n=1 Tax=Nocardioides anomalus TaxID=2712223 RepID=A0A6G6WAI0_9ACTN|nr:glycosyltransferase [Nocardioides anomalus]QIG42338.1 glycosyltransferase [Nocardioides anomalus]
MPDLPPSLVDTEWVEAQRAVGVDDPSPHPLLELDWAAPGRPWGAGSAVEWYLADPEHRTRSTHPLFALAVLDELLPHARNHPLGPAAAWLEHVGGSLDAVLPARADSPALTLGRLRELALSALHSAVSVPAGSGGVSLVLPVGAEVARTVNWIRSAAEAGVELVPVAGELPRSHRVLADTVAAAYGVRPVLRHDGPDRVSAAVAAAAGSRLVLVRPGAVPDAAAAVRLAGVLDDPGVAAAQPLLVDRSDVVVSAGGAFVADGLASHLQGHAPRDAEVLGRVDVPTLLSPVVALPRAAWDAAWGFAPLDEVGLGLRLRKRGRVVLEPSVRMTWVSGGLPGSPAWHRTRSSFSGRAPEASPRAHVVEGTGRLRWTIDTAATAGAAGETWGDLHFARSLAAALERRGQHVAVDPAPARERWSRELDDVVLVLRGLDRVVPRPGPRHVLWVISHPEDVAAEEAAAYDLVRAASLSWSRTRSAEWGLPVEPLLQCTDVALFHPQRAEPDSGAPVLFVGNRRGAARPALDGALAAGVEVTVYGSGWRPMPVAGTQVPNADLGALYAAAGVVLNDHWSDMRREGFLSNRLFDAAACAARVLSDDVPGIAEVFGTQVRTFTDPSEIGPLLAEAPQGWPAYDERLRLAERVAQEHSFDARAAELLDAVLGLR